MGPDEYLRTLAEVNRNGFGFLLAYGATWSVAAVVGRRFGARAGAYAVLFQGMVGLPLGLLLTHLGATGARPEDPTLGPLSVYLAAGQLLALPFVAVLLAAGRHTPAVALVAVVLAVHFVPYAWLYGTVLYLVVAAVVAVAAAALSRRPEDDDAVQRICAVTGVTLLAGGVAALAV
ncbi:DUF7010 family protein [Phycicoccus avicenniae]|uniref:DUF7010 family protein n=1 Tax=Phycicoccus avicenniae TaxID=2828860 RepID=UPI003D2E8169